MKQTFESACSIADVKPGAFGFSKYTAGIERFNDGRDVPLRVASCISELEAVEALKTVQAVARTILDAKKVGYRVADIDEGNRLCAACSYASEAVKKWVFFLAPVFDREPLPASVPALVAALSEVIKIAVDDEPLKRCPVCGRWFLSKRGPKYYRAAKPTRCHRERRAVYCSAECQTRHNNEVQKERRRAARAEREAAERGGLDEKR